MKESGRRLTPRKRAKRVKIAEEPAYPSREELSYERALAKSILGRGMALESEDAATLAAAVSSLTSSLKKISYNYGLSVGRAVYRLFEGRRHYRWYGDSIQDIILFFEKIGYNYILYKILTDSVEVSVHRKSRANLGCNIHSFDAGMLAGFLGAARGEFVRVTEVSCCNNGAESCRFTTAGVADDPFCTNIEKISSMAGSDRGKEGKGIRPEYHMLVAEPLTRHGYSGQVGAIFSHLGRSASMKFPEGKISARAAQKAADAMERFGLGGLEYTPKPMKMSLSLDGVKAKKEFADISISFLNGMMARYFGGPLKSQLQLSQGRKGSYRIIVKQ